MKLYVVTTGQYSDYGLHSIWTKKEEAEKLVEILNRDDYNYASVDEWETDQPYKERPGVEVAIDLTTGEALSEYKRIVSYTYPKDIVMENGPKVAYLNTILEREQAIKQIDGVWRTEGYGWDKEWDRVIIHSEHETKEKALKAAYDFRAAALARLQGI